MSSPRTVSRHTHHGLSKSLVLAWVSSDERMRSAPFGSILLLEYVCVNAGVEREHTHTQIVMRCTVSPCHSEPLGLSRASPPPIGANPDMGMMGTVEQCKRASVYISVRMCVCVCVRARVCVLVWCVVQRHTSPHATNTWSYSGSAPLSPLTHPFQTPTPWLLRRLSHRLRRWRSTPAQTSSMTSEHSAKSLATPRCITHTHTHTHARSGARHCGW
jgi:hypothetical protein